MFQCPLCLLPAGDLVHRGGIQAAGAHGMPRGFTPADGSLLAEGAQQAASLPRHPHLPRQAHPQPQQPPHTGGGRAQVELQLLLPLLLLRKCQTLLAASQ